MRGIDILVSTSKDVHKERIVAEQSIRWVAAELDVPVSVSCSHWLREQGNESTEPGSENQEDRLSLCAHFREHQDPKPDTGYGERILNPGQYDLVINILWSQLGTRSATMFVLPNGSQPGSATEYEVAWAVDQSKRTPGFPGLLVYWNRATPAAPLEPKEKREDFCRNWDAVQEFCAAWEKNDGTAFHECCHEYRDLEEFENLFREDFRDFLGRQLDCQSDSRKALRKGPYSESNPFRGLNFFDFEHAALFHGRTKAVWEVLDVLKNQAAAGRPFVLVVGPTGSGKSSLVRAGVLPVLTQGATPLGSGPWRRAMTRPGAGPGTGDPFDTLAAALVDKFALPELQDDESLIGSSNLASRLRKDPGGVVARIGATLDQLTRQELDHLRANGLSESGIDGVEVGRQKNLGRIKPKVQLALVVDQLEELFASGISPVLRRKYASALGTLAKCEGVFVIATLRSGFYGDCQQLSELVELTAPSGKYELQPPTLRGIRNIVQFRADAAGLRFERDPDTGRGLDDALVEAAIATMEPLPLLEHLLSRLYQRQPERKDGLLLWSDYRGLGELHGALAQHEKTVSSTLKADEKEALQFVIRRLVEPGQGEEGRLIRRTVPYHEFVSSPGLNERQAAGIRGLVDRLIKEGLLSADADPKQELLISVPQEALLRRWPGVRQWIAEDRHFFQMRDRLDASLKLWLTQGRHNDDLLERGIALAEGAALLRNFGSSLSERQIEYIRKSLAKQKRRRWVRDSIGIVAIAGLVGFAVFAGIGRFNTKGHHANKENLLPAQRNTDFVASQRIALETELKKAQEEKAQLAQQNADLATSQSALQRQLKEAEEKARLAQQNADIATSQRNALETELKKAQQEKAQLAQQSADVAAIQRSALETRLKKAEEKAQLAQQNADVATSQRNALETQLKKAEEKAQLAQENADVAAIQRSALETRLKKAEEKAQLAQQNADLANSQRNALELQLKKAQADVQQAQKYVNLDPNQRKSGQTQPLNPSRNSESVTSPRPSDSSLQSAGP